VIALSSELRSSRICSELKVALPVQRLPQDGSKFAANVSNLGWQNRSLSFPRANLSCLQSQTPRIRSPKAQCKFTLDAPTPVLQGPGRAGTRLRDTVLAIFGPFASPSSCHYRGRERSCVKPLGGDERIKLTLADIPTDNLSELARRRVSFYPAR
jgi:hypothetical protein